MANKKIKTARGEVVAIGEFKVRNSDEFPYEIPRLSYIIVQEAKNIFASTCIDLHIEGDGATLDEAEVNMGKNVYEYLCINFAKNRGDDPAWIFLNELVLIDENTKESWDAFNLFRFDLARKGIKTDLASELIEVFSDIIRAKEKEIKDLRINNKKQKEEIEHLNQENQKFMEVAEKAMQFAALLQAQTMRYLEYNSSWNEKR